MRTEIVTIKVVRSDNPATPYAALAGGGTIGLGTFPITPKAGERWQVTYDDKGRIVGLVRQ